MPNVKFTVEERVNVIRWHEQGLSYERVVARFPEEYPGRPIPSLAAVKKIVKKFKETGVVDPRSVKILYPTRRLSAETKANVLRASREEGTKPASRIAQEQGISKTSVWKINREAKRRSYKYGKGQQLLLGDDEQRLAFCQTLRNRVAEDESLRRICFTDESTILLVGGHNKQNLRVWADENPHLVIESQTQYQQKLNTWVGLCGDRLIGPFFIEGNLTGEKYLGMLREQIIPAVRALEGDGPPIWFQQDGAPPHYTVAVRAYLDQEFPGRWIGRAGPIPWPARSPDLTPLDYGLWGYVKNRLYDGRRIDDLPTLVARVLEILGEISPQVISNMTSAFWQRIDQCIAKEGGHFENGRRRRRALVQPQPVVE